MLASEIRNVILSQVEECDLSNTIERERLAFLKAEKGFATIVSGIRRCGKSTLIHQWCASSPHKTLQLNFDDLRMLTFSTQDFRALDYVISEMKPHVLCFDEIQTIPGWELYIRQKLDQNYDCIVTGSNASMLSRELGTKLTGRHLNMELYPFSYKEYLSYCHKENCSSSFEEYLKDGGFPSYLRTKNQEVLKTLLDDILFRDICVRYSINDITLLQKLCLYLFSTVANPANPSKLAQSFHVKSPTTMLEYFDYLEQAYLIQRLYKFSSSRRAQQLAPKKIYTNDNALVYATNASHSANIGFMLENAVFNFLKQSNCSLNYFSDNSCECDFIAKDSNGNYNAIQVCWEINDNCRERECNGLLKAMQTLDLKSGTIVTFNQHDFEIRDDREINIIPAFEYFTCQ